MNQRWEPAEWGSELVGVDPRLTKSTVDALARFGPSDREQLTKRLQVGRSTLARAVGALLDARMIVETSTPAQGRGRPRSLLAVNPSAFSAVGLDFGLRHIRGVVVDAAHDTAGCLEISLGEGYSVDEAVRAAEELINGLSGRAPGSIIGVGLALPGPVDRTEMTLTRSSILPDWASFPVMREFSERLPYPVVADNESNLSAYAEKLWGVASDADSMLYLKLHSGIGGAVLMNEHIIRGQHGGAGEFGHLSQGGRGPRCRCGNTGCLEAAVGIPGLLNAVSRGMSRELSFGEFVSLVHRGAPVSRTVLTRAAHQAGRALGTLSNAFDPQCVVIGGSLVATGTALFDGIREGFLGAALPMHRDIDIRVAALGRYGSALGATGLVFSSGFDSLLSEGHGD